MDRQSKRKIVLALARLYLKVLDFALEGVVQCRKEKRTQDKKPFDKSKHPQGEDGRFVYKTGTVGKGKGAVVVNLGFGSDKPNFSAVTATKGHDEHHAKHAADMGLNLQQWKQEAAELLNADKSNLYLDWYSPERETYFRYEINTNKLVIGDSDGNIKTYYILESNKRKRYMPKEYIDFLDGKK